MPPNTPSMQFEEIHTITNSEGLCAVITRKVTNGSLSLGLFKEFERNGVTERSPFFQPRQVESLRELLGIAEAWIAQYVKDERARGEATIKARR